MPVEPISSTAGAAGFTAATILLTVAPAGQYALIVFGALVGVMHSVAKVKTPTRTSAAWYVLKWVLTAALLTSFVTSMLQQHLGLPAERWPGAVAFGITFLADRWPAWIDAMLRQFSFPDANKEPQP